MLDKKTQAHVALDTVLAQFMPGSERSALRMSLAGEEGGAISTLILRMRDIIENMATTYEQDGLGDDAIVALHYFKHSADFWITEKDMGDAITGDTRQIQAFGIANLEGTGIGEGELGYISIEELLDNNVELDLYFTPATIRELKSK